MFTSRNNVAGIFVYVCVILQNVVVEALTVAETTTKAVLRTLKGVYVCLVVWEWILSTQWHDRAKHSDKASEVGVV